LCPNFALLGAIRGSGFGRPRARACQLRAFAFAFAIQSGLWAEFGPNVSPAVLVGLLGQSQRGIGVTRLCDMPPEWSRQDEAFAAVVSL
jgi:hypothetical protein